MWIMKDRQSLLSWSSLLLFDLLLLSLLILATRLATFLHEVMGHALAALALGGHVSRISIGLFGGGRVDYQLRTESLGVSLLVAFGGIVINLSSGLLAFSFSRRLRKQPIWALFLVIFGMVSLLGSISYAALGFYYRQGDPVAWTKEVPQYVGSLCIPFLIAFPFISYFTARTYLKLIDRCFFTTKTYVQRTAAIVLTLGLAGCVYAGLLSMSGEPLILLDAPSLAYREAEQEVRERKIEERFRSLQESHPELSAQEIKQLVKPKEIIVSREEVSTGFPLIPLMAALYVAGALLALKHCKRESSNSYVQVSLKSVIVTASLVGVVLGVLVWTGGSIGFNPLP
jgi:hypothetical protein